MIMLLISWRRVRNLHYFSSQHIKARWAILDKELCCAPMEEEGAYPRDDDDWSDWASVEDMTELTIGHVIELNDLLGALYGYKIICDLTNFSF